MGAPVRPGDILAGKYRVERVLGEGGMGVVVAARHLQLDQVVALKFLLPEAVVNPEALGRFEREARNAVRLRSEHVARIIDVGTLDHGGPYIVMEFLEGSDLAAVLAQQRTLPVGVAVDFVLQACDAIAEAHSLGIIHRDLKPQNLFVTRRHDGTTLVKVLDFGISKSHAAGDFAATRTQAVMGSPAYMSPEQMRSAKLVDARTDVWALGIILYELVLGHTPWHADTFTELCLKVAMDPLPPLPGAPRLPAGFEDVVRCCLAKDPGHRFPDISALAVALLPFAPPHAHLLVERIGRVQRGHAAMSASMPTAIAIGPGTLGDATGQRVTRTDASARKPRTTRLVVGFGAAIAIAVTAIALSRGGGRESDDRTARPAAPSQAAAQPARSPAPPAIATPPAPAPPPASTPPAPAQPAAAQVAPTPPAAPTPEPPVARAPVAAPPVPTETPPAAASPVGPAHGSTPGKPPDKGRRRSPARPAKPTTPEPSPDLLNSPD